MSAQEQAERIADAWHGEYCDPPKLSVFARTGLVGAIADAIADARKEGAESAIAIFQARAIAAEKRAEEAKANNLRLAREVVELSEENERLTAAESRLSRAMEALREIEQLYLGPDRGSAAWQAYSAHTTARAILQEIDGHE